MKILLWTVGSVVGLFLLIVLLIQIPFIQNKIKDKAVTYLEDKIHTKVAIGNVDIGFPKNVILERVYLESQQKDTLLYAGKLDVNISLFKLLDNQVEINSADLNNITANVTRDKDSVFNFDYIIKAFASKTAPKPDQKPMKISLGKINLDKIRVKFEDAITKNDLQFYFHHFDSKIEKFDLDQMYFEVPKIKLDGLNLKLKQGELVREIAQKTAEVADSLAKNTSIRLKLGDIALSRIKIGFDNQGSRLNTGFTLQKSLIRFNNLDIQRQVIDLESVDINDLKGALAFNKYTKTRQANTLPATNSYGWKIKLNQANFKKIDFKYDDQNFATANKGIDYNHLNVKNFNLDGEKFLYTSNVISGNIYAFTVSEKSGLHIQSLKTQFYYGPKMAFLKKLYLKTPQTLLRDNIVLQYPSVETLSKNVGQIDVNASLVGSQIGFKDILIFAPDLANTNPFKSHPGAILNINSKAFGKINNIAFPNLEISGIGSTKLAASGRITGLPDAKNAYFDLAIKNLVSSSKDIYSFVPKNAIPSNIQLPAQLKLKGTFKGKTDDFLANIDLNSSYGNAKIKAAFNNQRKNHEKYNADADLRNFDLGKLLKNKELGKISAKAKVKGTGLNPKTATAVVDAKIFNATYNKYNYKNGSVKGNIRNGVYEADIAMKDPNLTFDLVSSGSFKDKYPAVQLKLNTDIADLEKLNLHAGPLKIKGKVDADIPTADPDYLNGTITLHQLRIADEKQEYVIDSINIVSTATQEKNTIAIQSPVVDLNAEGKYKLTQIADAFINSFSKYYDFDPKRKKVKTAPQQVAFNVSVKNSPVLFQFLPELKDLEPFQVNGRFNTENDSIVLNASIPKIIYGKNNISNAVIAIDTQNNALVYNILVDDIQNDQVKLPFTNLKGTVQNNTIAYNLQLKDLKDKDRYLIAGNLKSNNGNTEIRLDKDLMLNYENWNVNSENLLSFGANGIYANQFVLSREGSSITIQSQSLQPNSPLQVVFKDFKIETLTNILQKETLAMTGNVNGTAIIKNLNENPVFTADMTISGFTFNNSPVGDINLKVNNEVANTYNTHLTLTGNDNDLRLDGNYLAENSGFDMVLDMRKLNFKSLEGFTMGNITQSSGFLSGKFNINGTVKDPKVVGGLRFNDVALRVTQLNSYFKSIDDTVVFGEKGVTFDNFTVTDEENNLLVVDGQLATANYTDYGFDLAINANNFKAVNSKEKDNNLYYGELYLDSRLKVKGNLDEPIVEGRIKINKDTKFTVVLPQNDPEIVEREGIVEFIDQDNPEFKKTITVKDTISKTKIKGIDASVNIEIDKEAELSLIIDKGNGDYLKLKGEAHLTGGIDPSGKTTLTGKYEFTEGTYEMTFNLIKRKFDIKEGSYILWTGEPTTADLSVTAVYKTEAAPIDLVGDQLGSVTPEIRNTYKQKIPFETNLIMKGELLKPDITFDIVLPDNYNMVSTEIINNTQIKLAQLRQQPSELNKQVFALLLLNRFIGENPFASESGGDTAESLARQSVSKILSQQLNNLASDMIKGVELDFDLESSDNYTSGQRENRTDLNVGVSKRLLDDRLKVTVGSTFGLEGQQQANEQSNNFAGDISAEYQLTKDGRYRVRAYRKNQYQVALQGQVVETGVAFTITMNYNRFKQLFRKARTRKNDDLKRIKVDKTEEQR